MAEIPIQEKRHGSKLPLILGALVALALIAWLLTRNGDDDATAQSDTARVDTAAAVTPLPPDTLRDTLRDTLAPATGTGTGTAGATTTRP